jgi:hypothetical protein
MIKLNKKLCNNCNTDQFIWKNDKGSKYCKNCWLKLKAEYTKPLKKKPINQKSKKMKKADKAYTLLRKEFMEEHPTCEASLICCTGASTDVHHVEGRGKNHLVVATWLSVCRSCHTWIHEHPTESRQVKLLK